MSVTFGCPDAPKNARPCGHCADVREWRNDSGSWPILDGKYVRDEEVIASWGDAEWNRTTCNPWCNGTEEISTVPEVNFANANARGVLALMGQNPSELWGTIEVKDIPAVMQNLFKPANSRNARRHLDVKPSDTQEEIPSKVTVDPETGLPTISPPRLTCRVIDVGNTDLDTLRRINAIMNLLSEAHKGGFDVCWG